MTSHDRVLSALARRPTGRVPRLLYEEVIGYTPPIGRLLRDRCAPRTPREYFDMDITRVTTEPTLLPRNRFAEWLGEVADEAFARGQVDEWGVWRRAGAFHHFAQIEAPLRGVWTLARPRQFPWPDPDQPCRFRAVREQVARLHAQRLGRGGLCGLGLRAGLAPVHVLGPETPWENIVAFFQAADEMSA